MRRIILIVLPVLLATAATGQKGRAVNAPLTLSYMLPRASFEIEVTLECTARVPGPFHAHAARQLGTRAGIATPSQTWRVKRARARAVATPDARAIFTLTSTGGDPGGLQLNLTPEGYLAGVGRATVGGGEEHPVEYIAGAARPSLEIEYARFGVASTQKEVLDSNFSVMEIDGEERRVWDPIERHVLKDEEELVQEITAELFATRRKLLDGLSSPGGLPAASIARLDELEKAYASLFLGKEVSWETTRVFTYTPERAGEATPLFRFSAERGITDAGDATGTLYTARVVDAVIAGEPAATDTAAKPALTYRVPATGRLRVSSGEEVLLDGPCIVPQLGYLKQIPLETISGEGLAIEFHPLHGSIRGVTREK
jgi:hypothetical protein